jgi:hypothetical protein
MSGKCDYCNKPFVEGQGILETDEGELLFCGSECAGAHYVESECVQTTYLEDDDDDDEEEDEG